VIWFFIPSESIEDRPYLVPCNQAISYYLTLTSMAVGRTYYLVDPHSTVSYMCLVGHAYLVLLWFGLVVACAACCPQHLHPVTSLRFGITGY
jgi:hypothetical protein